MVRCHKSEGVME